MLSPLSILSALAIFPALVPNNNTIVQFYGIERELFTAALEPNSQLALSRAQTCLQNCTNVNTPFEHDLTALHVAAARGHTELVGKLLEKGANAALKSEQGFLPIHFGAISGNVDLISRLVANRTFAIDTPNDQEQTPFYLALKHNQTQAARVLVENCANPNIVLSSEKNLLDLALQSGDVTAVKLLIKIYGFKISKHLSTPLVQAAYGGNLELIRFLIEDGVKPDLPHKYEVSPLDAAAHSDNFQEKFALELVQIFLSATNDSTEDVLKSRNVFETQTFWYRVIERNYQTVIDYLLNHAHFDVNQQVHTHGYTLLHYCAMTGNMPMFKLLIEHGASATTGPLYYSAQKGHLEMVKLLLREDKNSEYADALSQALLNNHTEVVYCLIEAGFDTRSALQQWTYFDWSTFFGTVNLNLTKLVLSDQKNVQQYNASIKEHAGKFLSISRLDLPSSTCNLPLIRYFIEEMPLGEIFTNFWKVSKCGFDTFDYLVKRGAIDLDAKVDGEDIVYNAVRNGQTDLVKHLVDHYGLELITSNSSRSTALIESAIMSNSTQLLKYLVDKGVPLPSVDYRFSENIAHQHRYPLMTPLMHAAGMGNYEMIKYLFNAHQNGSGLPVVVGNVTELLNAALVDWQLNLDLIKLIVSQTNTTRLGRNNSPLYRAIRLDRLDIVNYLIDVLHMSYRKTGPEEHYNPLKYAAVQNSVQIVKMLIDRHRASGWADFVTSQFLPFKFALPVYGCGVTTMTTYEIAKYLIFEYRSTSRHNQSMAHLAASVDDADSLRGMRQYGADLGILDSMGQTVIHLAATKGRAHRAYKWLNQQTCLNIEARDANVIQKFFSEYFGF